VFRADVLDNFVRVMPEQIRRVIVAEWFARVAAPVTIEIRPSVQVEGSLRQLSDLIDLLKRLGIAPDDAVINLHLRLTDRFLRDANHRRIRAWFDRVASYSGAFSPRIVTVEFLDKSETAVAHKVFEDFSDLKQSGQIAGVGLCCRDWPAAADIGPAVTPDFITLAAGFNVMRQEPRIPGFLSQLKERQVPVIAGGVFNSGFLLGGASLDGINFDTDAPAHQAQLAWRKAFTSLCHGHGVRPAHACIQFALAAPAVIAVSLKTSNATRVAENVQFATMPVPNALWASMKEEGLLGESYPVVS